MTVTGAENYNVNYSYDANNRLTQDVKTAGSAVTTGNYFYDPNGNQLARVSETLSPSGSGTSQIGIDSSDVELYEYDGRDRLVYSNVNDEAVAYTYRADGLRNSKETDAGKTTHLWDGANIAADMSGGAVIARYVRGIGLLMSDSAEGQRYFLYNGHGDVVQLANASGNIVKTYDFDAFGNERNSDPADTNPFRYCGEYFDRETGTIYLRARYYNPMVGRFSQQDGWEFGKLNDPLSLNLYTYCMNNPVMLIDPSGHEYDWIKKFVADLGILEEDVKYDYFSSGVNISFSYGNNTYLGTFYYDGTALQFNGGMASRKKIADNIDGKLYLERTDFYNIMGISYVKEEFEFTVTDTGNFLVSTGTGAATGLVTSTLNPFIGAAAGIVTGYIINENSRRPGDYRGTKITALIPEYSLYADVQYRLLETGEFFWKPDIGGFNYSTEPVVYYTYLFPALYN
ncbi:MAG: RHS repeat-associated core domain-containing protein [Firmicutes bacterium]|nr:RHS repeat-associated core domain-containing protein [Bacillota bacterium]